MSKKRTTPSMKVELSDALRAISGSVLAVANHRSSDKRIRHLGYDTLARFYGKPEDWMSDGYIRNALYQYREQIAAEHALWFKADDADHEGLLWTACPMWGVGVWEPVRISERAMRDGTRMSNMAQWGMQWRPSHAPFFRRLDQHGKKLHSSAHKLSNASRENNPLKLLEPGDDDE